MLSPGEGGGKEKPHAHHRHTATRTDSGNGFLPPLVSVFSPSFPLEIVRADEMSILSLKDYLNLLHFLVIRACRLVV